MKGGLLRWAMGGVFVIATACALFAASGHEKVDDAIFQEGLRKYIQSDYRAAIEDFEKSYAHDKNNKKLKKVFYNALLRQGDIEYERDDLPEARRLYARALTVGGEDEALLRKLRTIDEINAHVRGEAQRSEARLDGFLRTALITGGAVAFLFMGIVAFVSYRGKRRRLFKELLADMPLIDEDRNMDKDFYPEIVRANRLRELLGAIARGSLTAEILEGYIGYLNEEIKTNIEAAIRKGTGKGKFDVEKRTGEFDLPLLTHADGLPAEVRGASGMIMEHKGGGDPDGIFLILAKIIDVKTGRKGHSFRVADNAYRMASIIGESDPVFVKRAALVHDIGFFLVKGRIDMEGSCGLIDDHAEASGIIKTHPAHGAKILRDAGLPEDISECALYHHERYDGSGYPGKLRGERIPPIAMIVGAAEYLEECRQAGMNQSDILIPIMEGLFGKRVGAALFSLVR